MTLALVACQSVPTTVSTSKSVLNPPASAPPAAKYASSPRKAISIPYSSNFQIKNVSASTVIRKTIFEPQRFVRSTGKPIVESYTFTVSEEDLAREFLLNIINGPDTQSRISSAKIWINGQLVVDPEPFDQETADISVGVPSLKAGENLMEVRLASKPGSAIDISLEGLMAPVNIPGAVFSQISDDPVMRTQPFTQGIVSIKFLEGLKIRLLTNPDGTQKLVDLSGISLTTLDRLLAGLNVVQIDSLTGIPPEELDMAEQQIEADTGQEVPNGNLFYRLKFATDADVWGIVDQIKALPYIEEAAPEFTPQVAGHAGLNDPDLQIPDKVEWLKIAHIIENNQDMGAWQYTKGKQSSAPAPTVAILGGGAQIPELFEGSPFKSQFNIHQDFNGGRGLASNYIPVINVDTSQIPPDYDRVREIDKTVQPPKDIGSVGEIIIQHQNLAISVIGAVANNNVGSAGVAYEANIMPVHAFGYEIPSKCLGSGRKVCEPTVDALLLAAQRGAKIINIQAWLKPGTVEQGSLGVAFVINYLTKYKNVVVVIPAGNAPDRQQYPNGYDVSKISINGELKPMYDTGSIVVGGLNITGTNKIDPANNYGKWSPSSLGGHGADVSGPAERVWGAGYDEVTRSDTYNNSFSGTSSASAVIAGVATLVRSVAPNLSAFEIRQLLRDTAQPLNISQPMAGMVNAFAAIQKFRSGSREGFFKGIKTTFYANTVYMPPEQTLGDNLTRLHAPFAQNIYPDINITGLTKGTQGEHGTYNDPFEIGLKDFFVADFQGYIYADQVGSYRFFVGHDDGAILEIDNSKVIDANFPTPFRFDSSSVFLPKGFHPIRLLFNEIGGEAAVSLWWQKPDGTLEVVPSSALSYQPEQAPDFYEPKQFNLLGRFFTSSSNPPWPPAYPFKSKFFPQINFVFGGSGSFDPRGLGDTFGIGRTDNFTALFSGFIKVPTTGSYQFVVGHDDGATLYINGVQYINQPGPFDYTEHLTPSVFLEAGKLNQIILTYEEIGGESELGLFWIRPGSTTKEVVPASVLFY